MKKDKIKQKFQLKMSRRQVLKVGIASGAGLILPWKFKLPKAFADALPSHIGDLNDPATVKKFVRPVPDALGSSFIYSAVGSGQNMAYYRVGIGHRSGHIWGVRESDDKLLTTDIYGYDDGSGPTWPGKTFVVRSGVPIQIQWVNNLEPGAPHLLPVDTTLHWCYSLPRYTRYNIPNDGVPIITHVHGHHSQARSDGNPEEFFTYRLRVKGPRFRGNTSIYDNSQPAGNLWYHDHALGITRLNVYAGLAGFYFVRDNMDTGLEDNQLNLPYGLYEKAYAIQDRMFAKPPDEPDENGELNAPLFYPAFPGDPAYDEFIGDTSFPKPPDGNGLSALAEFFGDHMVVNGVAWPKEDVEPRRYRLHLLNGCDSRFLVIRFRDAGSADGKPTTIPADSNFVPFSVIGSDQGLASSISQIQGANGYLVFEPGSRYDIVVDFSNLNGKRIIMENIGDDAPFNGVLNEDFFDERQTDRIMAFDVKLPFDSSVANESPTGIQFGPTVGTPSRLRKVALFEGKDEFGRLQPLLGTAEPATDFIGRPINWPNTPAYTQAVLPDGTSSPLIGPIEGSIAWHSPTTENPALNTTEEWEIWNMTGDAHPVHLHLVHFKVLNYDGSNPKSGRQKINFDSRADEDGFVPMSVLAESLTGSVTQVVVNNIPEGTPLTGYLRIVDDSGVYRVVYYEDYSGTTFIIPTTDFSGVNASAGNRVYVVQNDGVFKVMQPSVQHNSVTGDASTYGLGFRIIYPSDPEDAYGIGVDQPSGYVENARKDMVTALPGQITRIKAHFDKPGRFVWHCHILSHEDHEMMKTLYVGPIT